MSYYRTCPYCEANLDPGEVCSCMKETAQGATNTQGGKLDTPAQKDSPIVHQGGPEVKT